MESILGITHKQFNKFLMFGIPESMSTKSLIKKIYLFADDLGIKRTKRRSDVFDRNTFNLQSFMDFFGKKRLTGRLYSKAQIYSVMNSDYIIPQYNFATHGDKMKTVKEKMYKEIQRIIKQWQSLKYFYFNFLIIEKYVQQEL